MVRKHTWLIDWLIWLHWVFVAARGLSLVAASGGYSSLRCVGFSLRWLLLLQSTGSRHAGFSSCGTRLGSCGSQALELRLSSCGTRAQLLRGMWDLPGPGSEPVSPALAGRFLATAPPGKSLNPAVLRLNPTAHDFSDSPIYFLRGHSLFWKFFPRRVPLEIPGARDREPVYWSTAQQSSVSVLSLGLRPNKAALPLPHPQGPEGLYRENKGRHSRIKRDHILKFVSKSMK